MQPIHLTEFSKLSVFGQVRLLGKLRLVYMDDAPLLRRFYWDFLREYRSEIRNTPFPALEKFDEVSEEFYHRFRLCTTIDDISCVLAVMENAPSRGSAKNLCLLTEFMEDLSKKCLDIANWTEEHQKQLVGLQPSIERHQWLSFLQEMLLNVRMLGVERVALVTNKIIALLKEQPTDKPFTKEQLEALFTSEVR